MDNYGKVYIQGNNKNEWLEAHAWQRELYIKCLELRRFPGLGYPSTKTDIESHNNQLYEGILDSGWAIIKLHNIKTDSLRRMVELPPHNGVKGQHNMD